MEPHRHAVYWVPPPGSLAAFGAAWLGWDPALGAPVPRLDPPGLPRPGAEITEAPRRYGLHATLGPPVRLADGVSARDVEAAVEALAASLAPARCEGLRVARDGGFVALRPLGDASELGALAAEVVRAMDPMRAPPSEAELARRRAPGLSPRQEAMLRRWGYPPRDGGVRLPRHAHGTARRGRRRGRRGGAAACGGAAAAAALRARRGRADGGGRGRVLPRPPAASAEGVRGLSPASRARAAPSNATAPRSPAGRDAARAPASHAPIAASSRSGHTSVKGPRGCNSKGIAS